MGYAGTAFCSNGIKLDSASAVVLVGAALTVYTIIAMSHCATHPLRLRSRPSAHQQKTPNFWEVKFYLVEKYSPHVRSRSLSG